MKVIIGFECSGAVRDAFIKRGHDAWSCDLKPTERPGPHITGDIFEAIKSSTWDLGIFHPPCTDLAVSGAAWFKIKQQDGRQQAAIDLFMRVANFEIEKTCLENPIGIMSTKYRTPDQIIEPHYFGDPMKKPTCLWLKNLPKLVWLAQDDLFGKKTSVTPDLITMTSKKTGRTKTYSAWEYEASQNHKERAAIRSKTFEGIANAMAEQWG